jgi:hypothetical protein
MKKGLFAFLKDRHIFAPQGQKSLHEYMTAQEARSENALRARKNIKKGKCKK